MARDRSGKCPSLAAICGLARPAWHAGPCTAPPSLPACLNDKPGNMQFFVAPLYMTAQLTEAAETEEDTYAGPFRIHLEAINQLAERDSTRPCARQVIQRLREDRRCLVGPYGE